MKKLQQLLPAICLLLLILPAPASTTPEKQKTVPSALSSITMQDIIQLSPRRFELKTGIKLKFKERIAYKILKWKLKKKLRKPGEPTAQQKKLGILSLIFGSIAVISILFILQLGIIAFCAAIAGLVLGIISLKGNSNTPGILGIIFSSGVLIVIVLAIIAITRWAWY